MADSADDLFLPLAAKAENVEFEVYRNVTGS